MPGTSQITLDVLRHLQVHGLQTRPEIEKALGKLPASTLSNLCFLRHVAPDNTQKDVRYAITAKGVHKLKFPNARVNSRDKGVRPPAARPQAYKPVELTSSNRPGSMYAYTLPSRFGDRLRWPDGTVTDLDHTPLPGETTCL